MEFGALVTDDTVQESQDVLYSGGPLDSDTYDMIIKMAYIDKSVNGATCVVFDFENSKKKTLKNTQWVTSGTEKGAKNYFMDKEEKKQYLPGFNIANNIALMTAGTDLGQLVMEEKVINIYSFKESKLMPEKKTVLTGLIGMPISLGVLKIKENKSVKQQDGKYVPTSEIREINEINKVFRTSDNRTVQEIKAGSEAEFRTKWEEKMRGTVKDKTVASTLPPASATFSGTSQGSSPAQDAAPVADQSAATLFGSQG